jgi:phytoene/squalene synthetase
VVDFYNKISFQISKFITRSYSTSFSIAVSLLEKEKKPAIYAIYGFVRFADEIVDSFEGYDKKKLIEKFESDYYDAINDCISLNPILNSFQNVVRQYQIPDDLIQAFLKSMKFDLYKNDYTTKEEINEYIYGSADVVGLMCLKVFVNGDEKAYNELKPPAMKLGSAFQKVNFLRDIKSDVENLDRRYFVDLNINTFDENFKNQLIKEIEEDFTESLIGLKKLPKHPKLAVYIAYTYYLNLLKKIRKTPAEKLIKTRIRVSDFMKGILLIKAYLMSKLNLI